MSPGKSLYLSIMDTSEIECLPDSASQLMDVSHNPLLLQIVAVLQMFLDPMLTAEKQKKGLARAGLVCTGGSGTWRGHVKGWDPRQFRNGSSQNPIFDVQCDGADMFDDYVFVMISVGSSIGDGSPYLLTGA